MMLHALSGDDRFENIIAEMTEAEKSRGGVTMCELLDKYENRGIERGIVLSIRNLMETMKLTAEQAMTALKIPESDRTKYMAQL